MTARALVNAAAAVPTVMPQTIPTRPHQPVPSSEPDQLSTRPDRDWRRYAPMAGAMALSAVLTVWALAQNGYANIYYSAGVKSMLQSWHSFFFLSADPAGLISIDKPPLGLWVQAASAEVFGFSPLSLLLPEALLAVAAVAALYVIVLKRFGILAASISAVTLAVFPSFVAVSRDNNVDTLLILLMTLACGAAWRASESGRLRTLVLSAVLVALAFNTKGLAAAIVVPAIAGGYVWCAPGSLRRRAGQVLMAGVVCGVLSLSWMVAVDLVPASQRPYVGSTTDNSELALTFRYNGFGRVGGQAYGPGEQANLEVLPQIEGRRSHVHTPAVALPEPSPGVAPKVIATVRRYPVSFGTSPGLLRLFRTGFGDQGAWMLIFALLGMVAIALTRPARRDPRLAGLIIFGGFFLVEAAFLSFSKGIVHPYYISALAPGAAVMVGAGAASMRRLRGRRYALILGSAVVLTAAVQIALLHHAHYMRFWQYLLIPLALLATAAALRARHSRAALAGVLAVLLVAPTAYAATTWRHPVQGTFPAAGPRAVEGNGGAGLSRAQLATTYALMRYVVSHGGTGRYQLLTEASLTADTPILLGLRASALGGYGGVDPALNGPGLARLVASGQARYVFIGDGYSYLGGNAASRAAARVCPEVPLTSWRGAGARASNGVYLVDCAGHARELAGQP